jgi:hypothetical protein
MVMLCSRVPAALQRKWAIRASWVGSPPILQDHTVFGSTEAKAKPSGREEAAEI